MLASVSKLRFLNDVEFHVIGGEGKMEMARLIVQVSIASPAFAFVPHGSPPVIPRKFFTKC